MTLTNKSSLEPIWNTILHLLGKTIKRDILTRECTLSLQCIATLVNLLLSVGAIPILAQIGAARRVPTLYRGRIMYCVDSCK